MSRLDGLQPGDWSYAAGLAGIAGFVFRTAQRYETETPRDGILWSRLLTAIVHWRRPRRCY